MTAMIDARRMIIQRQLPTHGDYLVLWKNSNEDQKIGEFLNHIVTSLSSDQTSAQRGGKEFRILDIGVGDGRKTFPFVRRLQSIGLRVQLDVAEPESSCMQAFQSGAAKAGLKSTLHRCIPKRWHEILPEIPPSHYDIVLSSHSAYEYMRYPANQLATGQVACLAELVKRTIDILAPNGVFYLIVGNPNNAVSQLRAQFLPYIHGENELDVSRLLTQLHTGARCRREQIPDQWLDVSRILGRVEDAVHPDWPGFLRFLFHAEPPAICTDMEKAVRHEIMDLAHKCGGAPERALPPVSAGGKVLLPIDDDCLIIEKQPSQQ